MWSQPIEWTAAGCVVAVQGCATLWVGLMLFVPMALGKQDGWYMAYYQKNKELYERVAEGSADILRTLEIEMGSHLICWAVCTLGALMAGGAGQIFCILEVPPMLCLILYFFRVNEKAWAIVSLAFSCLFCYFGFFPTPASPPVQWNAAGIFVAVHSAVCVLPGLIFLTGKTADMYKSQVPLLKPLMNREREILYGTTILGMGVASAVAFITNIASDYCLFVVLGLLVIAIGNLVGTGDAEHAKGCFFISLLFVGFGLFPRVMQ